jgi:hypothetical protein
MMVINYKYAFGIAVTLFIGWITFAPTPDNNKDRINELKDLAIKLEVEKDSLKVIAAELRVEKQLYLDSAQSMTAKFAEADDMKKRLIIGYEKILSDISDMSATEHDSFYSGRYPDND